MNFTIPSNAALVNKAEQIIQAVNDANSTATLKHNDRMIHHKSLSAVLNEIFAHRDKVFDEAINHLERNPSDSVRVEFNMDLEDEIDKILDCQRSLFNF